MCLINVIMSVKSDDGKRFEGQLIHIYRTLFSVLLNLCVGLTLFCRWKTAIGNGSREITYIISTFHVFYLTFSPLFWFLISRDFSLLYFL